VSPEKAKNDVQEWLQAHNFNTSLIEWDGKTLIAGTDVGQPDIVFVDESYGKQVGSIADYVAANYQNTLVVLMGECVPESVLLPGSFVTQVQPGNEVHLQNLYSLINQEKIPETQYSNERYTILVVDDNETNLQSAEIALQSFGHSVRTVSSGQEALRAMQEGHIDLVFMDMHMPGLSGIEVSKVYAAESKTPIPIVMLTADVTKAATADADTAEIAGFLTKPIKPSEMQLAVERYVRSDGDKPTSNDAAPQHRIFKMMASHSFTRENYIELYNSGVSVSDLDGLVGKFVEDAHDIVGRLQLSASAGDMVGVNGLLHKLKGSGAAMHIDGLLAIVDYYQDLSDEGRCIAIMEDVEALNRAITFIAGEIRRYIGELD